MSDSWRHFAAEFIGIFALVFVGGAAIMSPQQAQLRVRAARRRRSRTA